MSQQQQTLKRGLKNRHIQLIALGGAVGTGLFLGIATTIQMAGPSVLLGYALCGFIAFLIMRQLGEMIVQEPVAGSFSHFAFKYWGGFAGFLSGWNYWVMFILVGMTELTAAGKYMQHWWPELPIWVSAAVFFIAVNAVNLVNVRSYGETEFWFALIKVIAVVAMIIFGCYLLLSGHGGPQAKVSNLWEYGGFFANGFNGLIMALAIIMFSFGGLELVGITAAEAEDPDKSIPKAINQVVYRILIFYIGSLAVLLALYPWVDLDGKTSPFVLIFHELGDLLVANSLNVVILIAALSVYNSGAYATSRMLYGLAQQSNAPKFLAKVNKGGVPVMALLVSGIATSGGILINFVMEGKAFELLMSLVVTTLVLNWIMICVSNLKFRAAMNKQGVETKFKSIWYPFGNYLCLAFLLLILGIILTMDGLRISVLIMPLWIAVLWVGYQFSGAKKQDLAKSQQFS
ncbi:amino acid permease [Providencia rettgeri]|uniref:amino acid permease n=1 Tax=Providencia sp. PROV255 TaxID=2949943 RepID=UPI00234A33BF|nr:amino acid permease [Providencia sp. PROV255]MCL0001211.1 amino acid permease [Providencia rettgeri]